MHEANENVPAATKVGPADRSVVKRSIALAGRKTSISLEDAFWEGLRDIAGARRTTLSNLVASIDSERQNGNLSSAIRLFILEYYQQHRHPQPIQAKPLVPEFGLPEAIVGIEAGAGSPTLDP